MLIISSLETAEVTPLEYWVSPLLEEAATDGEAADWVDDCCESDGTSSSSSFLSSYWLLEAAEAAVCWEPAES